MTHKSIVVNVRGRTDLIEVFPHELPDDPTDVIEMLRAELAPLDIWCEFALAYNGRGEREKFREILSGVVDAFDLYEMQDFYRQKQTQFAVDRLHVLNLLAASATLAFSEPYQKDTRSMWKRKALEYIGRADKIDMNCAETNICKALYWIAELYYDSNALRNARYYAEMASHTNLRSRAANILCAILAYHEGNYKEVLKLYLSAMNGGACCDAALRIGISLAADRLGSHYLAVTAAQRALTLQPMNTDGLVLAACLRANQAVDQGSVDDTGTKMILKAADIEPLNSGVLNQLAHVLFWNWEQLPFFVDATHNCNIISCREDPRQFLSAGVDIRLKHKGDDACEARILCLRYDLTRVWVIELSSPYIHIGDGPERSTTVAIPLFWRDTPEIDKLAARAYHGTATPGTRAESYFILGRNRHVYCDPLGALPFYAHACELAPNFALAHFRLAQIQAAVGDVEAALRTARVAYELVPEAPEVLQLRGILELERNLLDEATQTFRQVSSLNDDPMTLIALGTAQEKLAACGDRRALASAAGAYEAAATLLQCAGAKLPPELWNNIGVVRSHLGDERIAKVALACVFESHACAGLADKLSRSDAARQMQMQLWHNKHGHVNLSSATCAVHQQRLTAIYANIVQLHASIGDIEKASEFGSALLKMDPLNVRCNLIAARLAVNMCEEVKAHKHIEAALLAIRSYLMSSLNTKSTLHHSTLPLDALSVVASLLAELGDHKAALTCLKIVNNEDLEVSLQVLQAVSHINDCHGQLSLKPRELLHDLNETSDAARFVMKRKKNCSIGANLLGVALLGLGCAEFAVSLFQRVVEAIYQHTSSTASENLVNTDTSAAPTRSSICLLREGATCGTLINVDVNIAHGHALVQRWTQAAAAYTGSLKRAMCRGLIGSFALSPPYEQTCRHEVYRCLAHALLAARTEEGSTRALAAAIHLSPDSLELWCDMAALSLEASALKLHPPHQLASRLAEWVRTSSRVLIERATQLKRKHQMKYCGQQSEFESNQVAASELRDLQKARLERVIADRRDRDKAEQASETAFAQLHASRARERQSHLKCIFTDRNIVGPSDQ